MHCPVERCREVRLLAYPDGMIQPRDLTIVETALSEAGPNDLVVRNRWFRISISTRLMANPDAQAVEGIPFPVLKPGDALADGAIGEVVACPAGSGFEVGTYVSHPLGWRDYAVVDAGSCVALGRGPIEPAAYLGHGWTAYAALTRGIRIWPGDTVFVSSGAGAIGSMAGQIARRLGASRVIGSTSTQDKADWMTTDLGYDAVILRNRGSITDQLRAAAPDGVDVFVDMVGGEQLAAAAAAARAGARFVLLGALTAELNVAGASIVAPVELDSFQLILRDVTLRGYSADRDSAEAFPEWIAWQREAGLHFACSTVAGLENAPRALHDACEGRLRGLVMVEV
ncbi:NADP-dependent oxidoreductase [Methylobacterium sp. J-072]|uniref:MDR family NADP-dependent oxidoreductase n=1 Tax=Methylobacterium sp. J-072 TaxID=2836651 RepID=UPI001FB9F5F5|nr:NADP-dependent oxidoreductase [Methylobacterium sp. J-072]MCJ2093172.1 NADP-dependent oxidoreductase [Methylobacterium sp. J-072]